LDDYLMRFLYTVILWLMLPYVVLRLFVRARKQPEYLHHLLERFGYYSINIHNPVIWLHAVSVGETHATQSLVARLKVAYPSHQILITHTTPTGREASRKIYGDSVVCAYLPYDYPDAVRRFLHHFHPSMGVLMETEIWFNLTHLSHHFKIPLVLLSARMSEKSYHGYLRFGRLTRQALLSLSNIAAQTTMDAERFTRLGAKNVSVMGNLKFDIYPPDAMLELGNKLRINFGSERQVFLAASTREGEEALLLNLLPKITDNKLLFVIVPRHPQRFDDVALLLKQRNIPFQRRSDNHPILETTRVLLGDSMGEMFAYYAACDIAFIGGSLLPFGGQNLIEACAVGTPVLIGPYTYNFSEATRLAVDFGAAIQVQSIDDLLVNLQHLFDAPLNASHMASQCLNFIKQNQGATDKAMKIIQNTMIIKII
jgi:3-deoxy-D-manno-octulosonic-acid transferase